MPQTPLAAKATYAAMQSGMKSEHPFLNSCIRHGFIGCSFALILIFSGQGLCDGRLVVIMCVNLYRAIISHNMTSGKNHFHEMNGDVGMAGWK